MATHDLRVGDQAPDFSLKDQEGQTIHLAELLGHTRVVLIFYPGDLTPGCTVQLCAVRDDWSKFQEANIAVLGINHAKASSHSAFVHKRSLPFPLLVDPAKKVSIAYGAVRKLFIATVIKRSVVGIDQQGIIRYLKRGMPKNADILKTMKSYA